MPTPRYDGHVRFRWFVPVLIGLLTTLALTTPSSYAATDDLSVHISSISPPTLAKNSTITLKGTATNSGKEAWTSVHAYMVMPRWPYTSREQVHDALASDFAYVGERIVDTDRFATIGDLAPGETKSFTIRVPRKELGLSSATGIYPIGVHLVATDPRGGRDPQSRARALTLLPQVDTKPAKVDAGLVWPFIETWPVDDVDPQEISQSVASGQLRRYLDAATATPSKARTLLIDPALLDSIEQFASSAEDMNIEANVATAMTDWVEDLVDLASTSDTWIISYGRPDYAGFSGTAKAPDVTRAIDVSTDDAAARHKLVGRTIVWPRSNDTSPKLLQELSALKPERVVVSTERLSDWKPGDGSVVNYSDGDTHQRLVAFTPLDFSLVEQSTSLFVQHLLSTATLASIDKANSSDARSDALTLINPQWDPKLSQLIPLWDQLSGGTKKSLLTPVTLSSLARSQEPSVDVRQANSSKPFSAARLASINELNELTRLVSAITLGPQDARPLENTVAQAVSTRWRGKSKAARVSTATQKTALTSLLSDITLEAPATITLSGQQGAFPLTIRNGTDTPIRVSLDVKADVPGIVFDDPPTVRIESGESHTMTLSADMGSQVAATVTAALSTNTGDAFGEPRAFVLRSSNVGQIVWIAMGLAILLVVAAGVRRFLIRARSTTSAPESGDEPKEPTRG